jgi:hypothetical protein
MGTYSPSAWLDVAMRQTLHETVVVPTVRGLAAEGREFRGVIFIGVMLTTAGPKVLEYNARFGDPETQVLIPRLDGDWLEVIDACARGELSRQTLRFREEAAVCVVMASGGYPGAYAKGIPIQGTEDAELVPDVMVFHAGTELDASDRFATAGGRGARRHRDRARSCGRPRARLRSGCPHPMGRRAPSVGHCFGRCRKIRERLNQGTGCAGSVVFTTAPSGGSPALTRRTMASRSGPSSLTVIST